MATKLKPIKDRLTKTQIQDQIATDTGLARKQVAAVLDSLAEVIAAHLAKNAVGEFVLPGLFKVVTVRKPAVKARKGIDPFTKQEKMFKAKPATTVVKVRPLKYWFETLETDDAQDQARMLTAWCEGMERQGEPGIWWVCVQTLQSHGILAAPLAVDMGITLYAVADVYSSRLKGQGQSRNPGPEIRN